MTLFFILASLFISLLVYTYLPLVSAYSRYTWPDVFALHLSFCLFPLLGYSQPDDVTLVSLLVTLLSTCLGLLWIRLVFARHTWQHYSIYTCLVSLLVTLVSACACLRLL